MKKIHIFVGCFAILIACTIFLLSQVKNREEKSKSISVNAIFTQDLGDNSVGEQVAMLQTLLKADSSLYTGPVSGFYTLSTKDAVIRFQKKYLIPPIGIVDLGTRLRLNEVLQKNKSIKNAVESIKKEGRNWGVAQKVEGTRYGWTMKIEGDITMGTAEEIGVALNLYRKEKGKGQLSLSQSLTYFAKQRAVFLDSNGDVDEHRGFKEYIRNPENRKILGYTRYGENTSCGYRMTATHMIRWIFAGDAPHDINQLNKQWRYVGVGVSGTCVSLVFAR